MTGFYTRYFVIGALALASVWIAVPELKKQAAERGITFSIPVQGVETSATEGGLDSPAGVDATDDWNGRNGSQPELVETSTPPATSQVPDDEEAPEPRSPIVPAQQTVAQEPSQPAPPPPEPAGPVYDWGLLAETTNSYTAAGISNGRLPGGTVVERISTHESSHGTLLRCRILRDQRWGASVYIPATAVIMFAGPYVEAPKEDRELLVRYFTLRGKIADRSSSLRDQAIRSNPHFLDYQKAAKALTEFNASAKDLVAKRDAATGAARTQLADQLRKLKGQEAQILHNFRRAEEPYKRWRARNDDGSAAIAGDSQINAWENEMQALEPRVRGMVGGL